ncbi:MAG: HAD-IC family P-type ATPase [Alphaproteobacteria bacterium]
MTDCVPAKDVEEKRLPQLAASLEQGSEHPLAEAIVEGAKGRGIDLPSSEGFEAVIPRGRARQDRRPGRGAGQWRDDVDLGVDIEPMNDDAERLRESGKTAMFVAIDGKAAGIVAVADKVKETTSEAIRALHEAGLRVIMATGDNRRTAEAVAGPLGIDDIRAEVSPEDKAALVKELQDQGLKVAMAGDGVNDAPALAAADVGIAMGTGADVAVESAGFTLVTGAIFRGSCARENLQK